MKSKVTVKCEQCGDVRVVSARSPFATYTQCYRCFLAEKAWLEGVLSDGR